MADFSVLPDEIIADIWSRVRLAFGERYRRRMKQVHEDVIALSKDFSTCETLMTKEAKEVRRGTEEFLDDGISMCGALSCRICDTYVPVGAEGEFCLCLCICSDCKGTPKCEECAEQIKTISREYAEFGVGAEW